MKTLIIYVYRNLNRKGVVYSVKCIKTGLVIDRSEMVIIKNPVFKVSESGRQRVLRDKTRNVHAGIQGIRISRLPQGARTLQKIKFSYNPYRENTFTSQDGSVMVNVLYVILSKDGAFAFL